MRLNVDVSVKCSKMIDPSTGAVTGNHQRAIMFVRDQPTSPLGKPRSVGYLKRMTANTWAIRRGLTEEWSGSHYSKADALRSLVENMCKGAL